MSEAPQFRQVLMESEGVPSVEVRLSTSPIPKAKRITKAIKYLAIFWTIAGFTVFVPILHFVLVPSFFLAGIFFAISGYTDDITIDKTEIPCGMCKQTMTLDSPSDQFPKWLECKTCSSASGASGASGARSYSWTLRIPR